MDHAGDGAFDRGHFAEHFAHAWHLVSTSGVRNLATEAEQQTHLGPVAHIGLVIAQAVAGRLDVDLARQHGVVMHKDLLPGDFDVVAQDHAVGFVVAIGKGCIELHRAHTFHRFARPQGQAGRVARHRTGDRLFLLVGRER